jgi:hypothetical protein
MKNILDPPFDNPDIVIRETSFPMVKALHQKMKSKADKLDVTMRSLMLATMYAGMKEIKTQQDVVDVISQNVFLKKEVKI